MLHYIPSNHRNGIALEHNVIPHYNLHSKMQYIYILVYCVIEYGIVCYYISDKYL